MEQKLMIAIAAMPVNFGVSVFQGFLFSFLFLFFTLLFRYQPVHCLVVVGLRFHQPNGRGRIAVKRIESFFFPWDKSGFFLIHTWFKPGVLYIRGNVLVILYPRQGGLQLFTAYACDSEFPWKFYFSQSIDIKVVVISSFHTNPLAIVFDLHTHSYHSVKAKLQIARYILVSLLQSTLEEFYALLKLSVLTSNSIQLL